MLNFVDSEKRDIGYALKTGKNRDVTGLFANGNETGWKFSRNRERERESNERKRDGGAYIDCGCHFRESNAEMRIQRISAYFRNSPRSLERFAFDPCVIPSRQ